MPTQSSADDNIAVSGEVFRKGQYPSTYGAHDIVSSLHDYRRYMAAAEGSSQAFLTAIAQDQRDHAHLVDLL